MSDTGLEERYLINVGLPFPRFTCPLFHGPRIMAGTSSVILVGGTPIVDESHLYFRFPRLGPTVEGGEGSMEPAGGTPIWSYKS